VADVEPNFKPSGPCEGNHETCSRKDACPVEGTLYAKGKDGKLRVRQCGDNVSRGRSNRRGGLTGQRRAAKLAGVPNVGPMWPGNEEHYAGTLRIEVKSGSQVKPMLTAFVKAEKQSEAQRPIGDNRPFLMGALETGSGKDVVYAFRVRSSDEMIQMALAILEQFGVEK
jgi:hypothetical protein